MATIAQLNNVHFVVGKTSSPTFTFPPGFTEVEGLVNLALAERQNPADSMTFHFLVDQGGGNFVENFSGNWFGQAEPNKLGNWPGPTLRVFNAAEFAGKTCRVDIDSNFDTTASITINGF